MRTKPEIEVVRRAPSVVFLAQCYQHRANGVLGPCAYGLGWVGLGRSSGRRSRPS